VAVGLLWGRIGLTVLILSLSTMLSAAEHKLAMEDAVQAAAAWHPGIVSAVRELYEHRAQVRVARAPYYPQLRAGVTAGHESAVTGQGQALRISISQMLYDFGKTASAVDLATATADRGLASVLLAVEQVGLETAQAAVEERRYRQMQQFAERYQEGVRDIADLARQRQQQGATSRSDVVQAESRLEQAEALLLQMFAQHQRWQSSLMYLVNSDTALRIEGDMPSALQDACSVPPDQVSLMPELMLAEAQTVEAQARARQSRARRLPTLSVESEGRRYLDSSPFRDANEYSVFLNFSVDLYQGGALAARREAADFASESADAARDATRLRVLRDLAQARLQSDNSQSRMRVMEARIASAVETRDLYREQYLSLGSRSLLDLLNAEQEIHTARIEQLETQFDLYRLQLDCLYNSGGIRDHFGLDAQTLRWMRDIF